VLLQSADRRSELILVELSSEFLDKALRNNELEKEIP